MQQIFPSTSFNLLRSQGRSRQQRQGTRNTASERHTKRKRTDERLEQGLSSDVHSKSSNFTDECIYCICGGGGGGGARKELHYSISSKLGRRKQNLSRLSTAASH